PGQMRSIASGKFSYSALCSPVAANALPGLRVHRRLRAGSPDRCAASPPGQALFQTSFPTNWPYQCFLKSSNGSHIHHFSSQTYCSSITFD
ncbi:hypothetical protein AZ036_000339, partial [Klebsiella michiganensis]